MCNFPIYFLSSFTDKYWFTCNCLTVVLTARTTYTVVAFYCCLVIQFCFHSKKKEVERVQNEKERYKTRWAFDCELLRAFIFWFKKKSKSTTLKISVQFHVKKKRTEHGVKKQHNILSLTLYLLCVCMLTKSCGSTILY